MTKFSNKFKKPYFGPIFPTLGAKKIFPENPAVTLNLTWDSRTMPNFK